MQASNLAQAAATRVLCADAFNEHAWPRSGDGDADRRQEDAASSSISREQQRLRRSPDEAASGGQLAKEQMEARKQGCRERSDAKVCVSASVAEGPSATLSASWIVDLAISAPLGMGRRPKHIYTLTLRSTDRGHPELSLGFL